MAGDITLVVPGALKEADDVFAESFALISDADKKNETPTGEQLKALETVKTAEEITAEAEAKRVADEAAAKAKEEADALAAENEGKTPEEIEADAKAKEANAEQKRVAEAAAKNQQQQQIEEPLLKRLAGLVQKDAAAEAAAAEELRQQQEAERVRKQVPQMSPEALARYTAYSKEFPEVAENEAAARRLEYGALTKHIFDNVTAHVKSVRDELMEEIAPYLTVVKDLGERTHLSDLQAAIPDYNKIPFDKLNAWIDAQPDYIQAGMKHVLTDGTKAQAVDLLQRFQKDTGLIPAAAGQQQQQPDPKAAARAKAAAALAPTDSKRSTTTATLAPTDFEGAFADFSKIEI